MATVARTTGLHMDFGSVVALDAVDLEIASGVTGVVGANGAGKSTLFKLMLGLLEPTEGTIEVLGMHPVRDGAVLRTRVGYSPERNVLPDNMAADEFVRHLAEVRGLPRGEARGRASDILFLVGLGEERFRPLGSMSTGQRQRVKLAQALAADPALVLLDEPTDGLDPMQREQMLELIGNVQADFGIDVIVTNHVLDEVEQVCDHVVVLDAGRLAVAGALSDLAGDAVGVEIELVATRDHPDPAAQVAALLGGNDVVHDVQVDGTALRVTALPSVDDDRLYDACRDAVASANVRLNRLGQRRISLEDVVIERAGSRSRVGRDTPGSQRGAR